MPSTLNKPSRLTFTYLVAIVTVAAFCAEAEGTLPVPSTSTSPLLVLLAAKDEPSVAVERQLVGELRLTLDTLEVEQVVIDREDFLDLTLPEQLAVVQPLIRRFMARAVVWVTVGTNGGHLIQFVVTDRGNATVRTVEAGSAEELALAVRELLDASYLFEGKQNVRSGEKKLPRLSFGMNFSLNGGIYGHEDTNSLCGGMGIFGRYDITRGFFMGIGLGGKHGPTQSSNDGILTGWRFEVGGFTGYRFNIGRFGIGPYAEATALRSYMRAILGNGEYDAYDWWSFRGALGIEALLRLSDNFSIIVEWTAGGIVKSRRFYRVSNQSTELATPRVDYAFTIGFVTGIL